MKNNKTLRLAQTGCGRGCHFSSASGPHAEPTKKPAAVSHPGAALVNALFWKILVTRVKSFLRQASRFRVPGAAQRACNDALQTWDCTAPGTHVFSPLSPAAEDSQQARFTAASFGEMR